MDLYKFGPEGDISVVFSSQIERDLGSYCILPVQLKLIIQLLCHAVLQIKSGSNLQGGTISANNIWRLRQGDEDRYFYWEPDERGKLHKVKGRSAYICPVYDLSYEGSACFSMQETPDGGVIIYRFSPEKLNQFIDSFLDSAAAHAELYGRF